MLRGDSGGRGDPAATTTPATGATNYAVDPAKSWLGFTAKQSGGDVDARFDKFSAQIAFADANLAASHFDVQVTTQSVNSQDSDRDTVLRDKDLFDSTKYPTAHFVTSTFTRKAAGQYERDGQAHGPRCDARDPPAIYVSRARRRLASPSPGSRAV